MFNHPSYASILAAAEGLCLCSDAFVQPPTRPRHCLCCRAVLVFNHPSYVDAAVMASLFTPSGVSKAGVAGIPFIGLFGVALQVGWCGVMAWW